MTFVIGDIHGEITKLKSLYTYLVKYNATKLIFIGDYINKGENSKLTLDFLVKISKEIDSIFLIGNHEYMWLEYLKNKKYKQQLIKYASASTLKDFSMNFNEADQKLYIPYQDFFNSLQSYYETNEYLICHAGIDISYINKSLDKMPIEAFLFTRYDFINYSNKIQNKITIFGHTGFMHPYIDDVKIGIDTAAVYGPNNPLTAFCLEEKFFINSNNNKIYLNEMKNNICPIIIRNKPYREDPYEKNFDSSCSSR